jgi:flagellar biosynthesis protein FlhB
LAVADETDKESRTEEPSEKKTQTALERGDAPMSRDLVLASSLLGLFLTLQFLRQGRAGDSILELRSIIAALSDYRLGTGADATRLISAVLEANASWLAGVAAILISAALGGSMAQNAPRLVWRRIRFDLSRVDPGKGVLRMVGPRGLADVGKSAAKIGVVVAVSAIVISALLMDIVHSYEQTPAAVASLVARVCTELISYLVLVFVFIGVLDLVFSRLAWRKRQRMTRQELKDEMKQSEGDPLVKSRLRSLAMDRARQSMISDVGRATFVIANPVHFAIAFRYVRDEGGAPLVLAKGQDLLALKIRERAELHNIPVIENPPLARAMYGQVEVGQMIPAEYYRAIAEIVNVVSRQGAR